MVSAATTTPIDDVAEELIEMIDARGSALLINAEIQPSAPAVPPAAVAAHPDDDDRDDGKAAAEGDVADGVGDADDLTDETIEPSRRLPANPVAYERWRSL